ncbi:B12-binding domain-containing radical SAM protein [Senegalia massiliensis]|uniref:B12-binding domain-containing radical SAM protein n=1 Tax=Senegalia massiliensis TaxID=1720316 RepID=UPI001030793E|nr:radical SAM protein [Senegalia massiliensis]
MKVVFVYPKYTDKIHYKDRNEFPPLGMLYICSIFEENGYEVEVIPMENHFKEDNFPKADIYCLSITAAVTFPMFLERRNIFKLKSKILIVGNTHATTNSDEVLEKLEADVVFRGESEESLRYWFKNGCVDRGIIESIETNINIIPFPARHLLPPTLLYLDGRVGGTQNHVLSIMTSRGCTYKCMFCGIQNRKKVKFRRLDSIKKEVEQLLEQYPLCDGFTVMDETFTFNKTHAIGVANILGSFQIDWECNSRLNTVDEDIIKTFAQNNCKEIRFGMETGSQQLLNKMKKGIKIIKAEKTLELCKKHLLPVKLYLMHGFPGEDESTTEDTIKFLRKNRENIDRISLYRFVPLPGSLIYNELKDGLSDTWESYTIYDNDNHWWGTKKDFEILNKSYLKLENEISKMF